MCGVYKYIINISYGTHEPDLIACNRLIIGYGFLPVDGQLVSHDVGCSGLRWRIRHLCTKTSRLSYIIKIFGLLSIGQCLEMRCPLFLLHYIIRGH